MIIPYWLLKLLPIWQFICPKCKGEVKKNSHECPHCSECFPLAIRVPLSFLKDPKKLEAYVHTHIFPRCSEFERNYLTKYFTVLFSDGFESDDFSAWTGTQGSPSVVSTWSHHGTYSAYDSSTTGNCYKLLASAQTLVYCRSYNRFTTVATGELYFITFYNIDPTAIAYAVIVSDGVGNYVWRLYGRNGAGLESIDSSVFALDTAKGYSVELVAYIHASAGYYYLYVDGVLTCSLTSKDSDNLGNIAYIQCGNCWSSGTCTINWDCVVVADAYIGPEAAGVTVKKGSNLSGLMTQMLNSKMLYSAINRFPKLSPRTI